MTDKPHDDKKYVSYDPDIEQAVNTEFIEKNTFEMARDIENIEDDVSSIEIEVKDIANTSSNISFDVQEIKEGIDQIQQLLRELIDVITKNNN